MADKFIAAKKDYSIFSVEACDRLFEFYSAFIGINAVALVLCLGIIGLFMLIGINMYSSDSTDWLTPLFFGFIGAFISVIPIFLMAQFGVLSTYENKRECYLK